VIQKQLVDKLALRLLEGEFVEGDAVEVDAKDGGLSFSKATGATGAETHRERAAA
jgi:ATP-dependent Clp protease ATP-binding subunit ClpB